MNKKGNVLRQNNEQIVKCLEELRRQREELNSLILKQKDERETLLVEVERMKYKISLIAKSLEQRLAARDKYDQTIREAEAYYEKLVEHSTRLLGAVQKDASVLEECNDKKSGTETINSPALAVKDESATFKPPASSSVHIERVKLQQPSSSRYKQISQPIFIYETIEDASQATSLGSIGTVSTLKSASQKPHSSNTAIYPGMYYPELSPSESYDVQ